jgi:hypothetical protein
MSKYRIFSGLHIQKVLDFLHSKGSRLLDEIPDADWTTQRVFFLFNFWIIRGREMVFVDPRLMGSLSGSAFVEPPRKKDIRSIAWPKPTNLPPVIAYTNFYPEDGEWHLSITYSSLVSGADMFYRMWFSGLASVGKELIIDDSSEGFNEGEKKELKAVIRMTARFLNYMEAFPQNIEPGLPNGVKLRHLGLKGRHARSMIASAPRDATGAHFRIAHFRRYPIRPDGTRRDGIVFVQACLVNAEATPSRTSEFA